ncbi:ankyrin repeat-containing domain protein [Lentinula edodes]|uniref:ankyrin repeat-containing domain protein n=1 Tax=Lentinula edodes TaxID=5353 RepID=UPI001E8E5036|nr:ankyrin repeat-containing domain protein [Lentinula edodes]KAH7872406.1 ankyrin repeat-containing domain protein [Lentinula edodes]
MHDNWHTKYPKLGNYADRVAKAIWATLSKFQEFDFQKSNFELSKVFKVISSSQVGTLFVKGTIDYWNHLVSNNKSQIISKCFEYSKSQIIGGIDFEDLGITKKWTDNALVKAVSMKYLEMTKVLVEKISDVNTQGGEYENTLQAAAYDGNPDIVKFLVENNANLNAEEGFFEKAMQAAVYKGNLDIVKFFVEKNVDVNAQGGGYGTALQAAAYRGNLATVKFLVEKNANVNAQFDQVQLPRIDPRSGSARLKENIA